MISRSNDIIILLGAGASVDAGIPASQTMIEKIEALLESRPEWSDFRELYFLVKSSILYVPGLRGQFNPRDFYNIETLVQTLYELERREEHPLYPFVSDWKSHLVMLAGRDFKKIETFRKKILDQLKAWVQPENQSDADYYDGLTRLQAHLNFPMKVFSLNYDLCVERLEHDDFHVETGFEPKGKKLLWDWRRFDESNRLTEKPAIYLYKMHGSINWKRDEADNIVKIDYIGSNIPADEMPIIFGKDFKLEADDPYLFYAYEFRRCTLEAKLILTIGYGFGDDHINKMLRQALRREQRLRVAAVGNTEEKDCDAKGKAIGEKIRIDSSRVQVISGSARVLLERKDISEFVLGLLPPDEATPF
jgi:hypothetical protein